MLGGGRAVKRVLPRRCPANRAPGRLAGFAARPVPHHLTAAEGPTMAIPSFVDRVTLTVTAGNGGHGCAPRASTG